MGCRHDEALVNSRARVLPLIVARSIIQSIIVLYYCCTQQQLPLSSNSKQQPARHCSRQAITATTTTWWSTIIPMVGTATNPAWERYMRGQCRVLRIYLGLCLFVFLRCVMPPPAAAVFFFARNLAWSVSQTKHANPKSIHLIGVLRFFNFDPGLTTHHPGRRVLNGKPGACGDGTCSCHMRYMDRAVTAHGKKTVCTRHAVK